MDEVVKFLKDNKYNDFKINEPLSKHTTFRVGGKAKIVVSPSNKEKLVKLLMFINQKEIPYKILGKGSNILPSDEVFDGVIIKTNKALNYYVVENDIVRVGAGYSLVKLAYNMVLERLTGLEFLGGIPGSIGGAIYMNAGAYNKEMKDVVIDVTLLDTDGKIKTLKNEDLGYEYRKSILQERENFCVLETRLKLEKGDKEEIKRLLQSRKERRKLTQPLEFPSAGSTFRNPKNTHAYLLIDEAGLRGYSVGGAKVSCKHCNFIINYEKASSMDIKQLIDYIIYEVEKCTNVKLIPEVEFFNWKS